MRALVVDDSAAMRRMQQNALIALGWEVQTAGSGGDALSVLEKSGAFDLILTDWHMPGMDGLELVRAVRADARFARVRILMVTSEAVMEAIEAALGAGANDFLMKPFSKEALNERVREVMLG